MRGFDPGTDRIEVSEDGFGGGLLAGVPLFAQQLVVHASGAATAPVGLGQFVFDTTRSLLLWDADGTGAAAAPVALAELRDVTTLATTDIVVVA